MTIWQASTGRVSSQEIFRAIRLRRLPTSRRFVVVHGHPRRPQSMVLLV